MSNGFTGITINFFPPVTGQSYEIRMLDNRKMGELPEINGKMVKVRICCLVFLIPYNSCFPHTGLCAHQRILLAVENPLSVLVNLTVLYLKMAWWIICASCDYLWLISTVIFLVITPHRALSVSCFTTAGFSTLNTSSWRAGAGTDRETESLI